MNDDEVDDVAGRGDERGTLVVGGAKSEEAPERGAGNPKVLPSTVESCSWC